MPQCSCYCLSISSLKACIKYLTFSPTLPLPIRWLSIFTTGMISRSVEVRKASLAVFNSANLIGRSTILNLLLASLSAIPRVTPAKTLSLGVIKVLPLKIKKLLRVHSVI